MRRREVLAALAGGVTSASRAHAQPPAMPVIGFLSSGQPNVFAHLINAFRQGLNEVGYVEGRNVAFEHRAAGSEYDRFRAIADELVRRQVAVIFANGGTAAALAAKGATTSIPVVFYMGGDPVKQGVVVSLNRPGGNLTGVAWLGVELGAKRLELLRDLLPNATMIAVLVNPNNPDSEFEMRDVHEAARVERRQVLILSADSEARLNGIFATLVSQQVSALVVASDPFFSGRRGLIVALAARHAVPTVYERREYPDAGGLISYGHHRADAYRQLGVYAGRILQGAKPADLPVLRPSRFELVINLNAAKALGLTIPPTLLARADEVIE
jgi:putative tryptophan/tyrosine transport system substrate-binding protein